MPRGTLPSAKTVLVTGAAGFIGSWVVEEFVAQGWRVLALIHRKKEARWQRHVKAGGGGSVIPVTGDVTDSQQLRAAIARASQGPGATDRADRSPKADIQVIVHAAGRASDVGRRGEFRRQNLEGVRNVGTLALNQGVPRFVFLSTTDVYGIRDFHGEAEEELDLGMTVRNPYPEFKIRAEEWIREHLPPDRYVLLRPGAVWGPGDTTLTPRIVDFLRWTPAIIHFGPWKGANRWPLAHVRNVALAAFLAASRPEALGQAINVLDTEHTSLDTFYRILAQTYLPEKSFRTLGLPTQAGKALGWVVSQVSTTLNLSQPFMDPSYYAVHHVSSNLDLGSQRLQELALAAGRTLVTLEEGMEELRHEAERTRRLPDSGP